MCLEMMQYDTIQYSFNSKLQVQLDITWELTF